MFVFSVNRIRSDAITFAWECKPHTLSVPHTPWQTDVIHVLPWFSLKLHQYSSINDASWCIYIRPLYQLSLPNELILPEYLSPLLLQRALQGRWSLHRSGWCWFIFFIIAEYFSSAEYWAGSELAVFALCRRHIIMSSECPSTDSTCCLTGFTNRWLTHGFLCGQRENVCSFD